MSGWAKFGQGLMRGAGSVLSALLRRVYDNNSVVLDVVTINQDYTPLTFINSQESWRALKWTITVHGANPLEVGDSFPYPRSTVGNAANPSYQQSIGQKVTLIPNFNQGQPPAPSNCPNFTWVVNDRHPTIVAIALLFLDSQDQLDMLQMVPLQRNLSEVDINTLFSTNNVERSQRLYPKVKDFLDGHLGYLSGYDDKFSLEDGFSLGDDHPARLKAQINKSGDYLILSYRGLDWITSLYDQAENQNFCVYPQALFGTVSGIVSWDIL